MPEAATGINRQTERSWPGKKTEKETVLTEKKVRIQDAILQYQGMNAKKRRIR